MKIITIDISYVIDKHYLNGFKITCSNLFKIGLKIVNDILKINDIRTVFI